MAASAPARPPVIAVSAAVVKKRREKRFARAVRNLEEFRISLFILRACLVEVHHMCYTSFAHKT
jgi:hypothetical protein